MSNCNPPNNRYPSYPQNRRREYLKGKCCTQCGSVDRLEFHHVDPSTKIKGEFWAWGKERREAELAKCVILCRACHIEVTREQQTRSQHGTLNKYLRHRCRCELCVRRFQEYGREYRRLNPRDQRKIKREP